MTAGCLSRPRRRRGCPRERRTGRLDRQARQRGEVRLGMRLGRSTSSAVTWSRKASVGQVRRARRRRARGPTTSPEPAAPLRRCSVASSSSAPGRNCTPRAQLDVMLSTSRSMTSRDRPRAAGVTDHVVRGELQVAARAGRPAAACPTCPELAPPCVAPPRTTGARCRPADRPCRTGRRRGAGTAWGAHMAGAGYRQPGGATRCT